MHLVTKMVSLAISSAVVALIASFLTGRVEFSSLVLFAGWTLMGVIFYEFLTLFINLDNRFWRSENRRIWSKLDEMKREISFNKSELERQHRKLLDEVMVEIHGKDSEDGLANSKAAE